MTREAKAALRGVVLRRRDALTEEDRASLSRRIVQKILDLDAYGRSSTVLAYASFGSELRTDNFLERVLGDGKVLLLPRVERGGLGIYQVRDLARDLVFGTWGIREPDQDLCPPADPGSVEFALVPGLAFDRRGWRLGYGGGFYDRLLGGSLPKEIPTVSGTFEVQMVDEIPVDPHDVPVHAVVTEKEIYPPNNPTVVR